MSENYENTTNTGENPVEETVVAEEVAVEDTVVEETEEQAQVSEDAEEALLELETLDDEQQEDPEKDMTTGQKLKVLLMKPLATSIIKWVCAFFGIVGLVLYLVGTSSRSMGEMFAEIFCVVSGGIASFFSLIPISMFEIIICATALGILAYLVFIIVRTFQVKGKFHKGGLWVQFGYTLIAVAGVFALLISMCYGVFTYRQPLSKSTDYTNAKVTNQDFGETMLYLIDRINNTLYDGTSNETIFFTASGHSRYATSGRSTDEIAKKVSKAFENAAQDIPTLKGNDLSAKQLIFSGLYSKFRIASIYSPFTGEICVNSDYPEVVMPMQIAKAMAIQRGYTNDADAAFIAYLVCTEYSDDDYIKYSGYFNAYVELSSKFYNVNGKNLHLYMANTLKETAKREYVQYVKKLDNLYGLTSELEYTDADSVLAADKYCDVAKLMIVNFRQGINKGNISVDNTEPYNFGKYCNYLVNNYLLDDDFQEEIDDIYEEYHPSR